MLQFLQHALHPHDSGGGDGGGGGDHHHHSSSGGGSSSTGLNGEYSRALIALTAGTAVGALTHGAWTHTRSDHPGAQSATAEAIRLKQQNESLFQDWKLCEQELDNLKHEHETLDETYIAMREAYDNMHTEINRQAYHIQNLILLDERRVHVEHDLAEEKLALISENTRLLSESAAHKRQIQKQAAQLRHNNETISALRAHAVVIKTLSENVREIEQEDKTHLISDNERLLSESEAHTRQIHNQAAQLSRNNELLSGLTAHKAEIQTLSEHVLELKQEHETLTEAYSESQTEVDSLKQEKVDLYETLEEAQSDLADAKSDLLDAKSDIQTNERAITRLRNRNDSMEPRIEDLQREKDAEINKLLEQNSAQKLENDALQQANAHLNADLSEMRGTCTSARLDASAKQTIIEKLQYELDKAGRSYRARSTGGDQPLLAQARKLNESIHEANTQRKQRQSNP